MKPRVESRQRGRRLSQKQQRNGPLQYRLWTLAHPRLDFSLINGRNVIQPKLQHGLKHCPPDTSATVQSLVSQADFLKRIHELRSRGLKQFETSKIAPDR